MYNHISDSFLLHCGYFLGQNIYSQISHFCSPDVREFFSLDNPKNAQTINDQDDQPGADESDVQVIFFC